jgi:SPP1 family predicted phage head-tail adaptor
MSAIRQLTQEEKESESQMFVEGDYVVECWYTAGITADMRIKAGNKTYEITGIDNVHNRNKWMKIRCKELK